MVVEQAASATPTETRVAPDGVGYTWAECESYFFDANLAVEFWEAAQVVDAPESLLSPALFRHGLHQIRIVARLSVWIPQ